jgi:hypothetical protein
MAKQLTAVVKPKAVMRLLVATSKPRISPGTALMVIHRMSQKWHKCRLAYRIRKLAEDMPTWDATNAYKCNTGLQPIPNVYIYIHIYIYTYIYKDRVILPQSRENMKQIEEKKVKRPAKSSH